MLPKLEIKLFFVILIIFPILIKNNDSEDYYKILGIEKNAT